MNPDEIFYILGSILIIVFVGVFLIISLSIIKTLHYFQLILMNIEKGTRDLETFKDSFKQSFLKLFVKLVEIAEKRK